VIRRVMVVVKALLQVVVVVVRETLEVASNDADVDTVCERGFV